MTWPCVSTPPMQVNSRLHAVVSMITAIKSLFQAFQHQIKDMRLWRERRPFIAPHFISLLLYPSFIHPDNKSLAQESVTIMNNQQKVKGRGTR